MPPPLGPSPRAQPPLPSNVNLAQRRSHAAQRNDRSAWYAPLHVLLFGHIRGGLHCTVVAGLRELRRPYAFLPRTLCLKHWVGAIKRVHYTSAVVAPTIGLLWVHARAGGLKVAGETFITRLGLPRSTHNGEGLVLPGQQRQSPGARLRRLVDRFVGSPTGRSERVHLVLLHRCTGTVHASGTHLCDVTRSFPRAPSASALAGGVDHRGHAAMGGRRVQLDAARADCRAAERRRRCPR
jgi:hypothetical protein